MTELDENIISNMDEMDHLTCTCLEKLIPALNRDYAVLIRELELNQKPTNEVAAILSLTRDNLKVKRHRARRQLKQRLEETCRLCAKHGCLDCDCEKD